MLSQFSFFMPTGLHFGPGSLNKLATLELPGKKALIVTGGSSTKRLGYIDRCIKLLAAQNITAVLFDKVQPNPLVEHVMEAAALARKEGCDFIIGLGGGSSMDSAKSIAIMVKNPGTYWDYIGGGSGKAQSIPEPILPIVCITTTAGTGTEADPWTVITKSDTHEKIGFGCMDTFPTISIIDPELMLSIPPDLTAYQGFDAFFHALEGYIANIATPISDLFALKSMELIIQHLPTAVHQGDQIEARSAVAFANTLSGIVESTSSCTSEHSIEHAMSAYHPSLPHGAGLIMISHAYHEAYAPSCPERYAVVAKMMNQEPSIQGFLHGLLVLQKACGVDQLKMSDYGFTGEDFSSYAHNAKENMGGLFGVDRPDFTHDDIVSIMQKSYQ